MLSLVFLKCPIGRNIFNLAYSGSLLSSTSALPQFLLIAASCLLVYWATPYVYLILLKT